MLEMNFTERENMKKLFHDSLVIQVNDLGLDLTMSTVTGLADLAEDEIIVPPIPLEVSYFFYIAIENILIYFKLPDYFRQYLFKFNRGSSSS